VVQGGRPTLDGRERQGAQALKTEIQALRDEIKVQAARQVELEERRADAETEYVTQTSLLEAKLQEKNQEFGKLNTLFQAVFQEKSVAEAQIYELRRQLSYLRLEPNAQLDQIAGLIGEVQALRGQNEETETKVAELTHENEALRTQLEQLRAVQPDGAVKGRRRSSSALAARAGRGSGPYNSTRTRLRTEGSFRTVPGWGV
jgi:chromosome segregation ATPase